MTAQRPTTLSAHRSIPWHRRLAPAAWVLALGVLSGCTPSLYVTPVAAPADLSARADAASVVPIAPGQASLPVRLGMARVQSGESRPRSGDWTLEPTVGLVGDEQLAKLRALPGVADAATLSRMLVGPEVNELTLRQAAARMGLDVLLLTTFEHRQSGGDAMVPLSVVTLGLSPSHVAETQVAASAVLLDVRSGQVLASMEASGKSSRLANTYTARDAAQAAAFNAEREAAVKLLEVFIEHWPAVQGRIMAGTGWQARPQGMPAEGGWRSWPTASGGAEPPPGGAVYRTDGW